MLYHWYELSHAAVGPARMAADVNRFIFGNPFNPLAHTSAGRQTVAACEVFERSTRRYEQPVFGIASTEVDGTPCPVREDVVWQTPFVKLRRFTCDPDHAIASATTQDRLRMLVVAPMSGHFSTLLRGTVEALLPHADIFITDWQNARNIPADAGPFDLDDYIDTIRAILTNLGGGAHVFAVCQPSVPVLAAIALMEEDNDPALPASMILAGGPVDTRQSPTIVNTLAEQRGIDWFRDSVIAEVPWPHAGHGRHVYPGFLQLTGFMTMNLDGHIQAHRKLFDHLVDGDGDSAEKHRTFYDEYLAVMDLTAEFYLQTVETVFIRHALPSGEMTHRGRPVRPGAIRRTALMTIEGEKDDITGIGQCRAAHSLCSNIDDARRSHFEAPGVGHYGIFNGSRFRHMIAPRIIDFARRAAGKETCQASPATVPLTPQERDDALARGRGAPTLTATLAETMAFSFSAANDATEDPASRRLKRDGLGQTSTSMVLDAMTASRAHAAPWQLLTVFTHQMVDQMFGLMLDTRPDSQRSR